MEQLRYSDQIRSVAQLCPTLCKGIPSANWSRRIMKIRFLGCGISKRSRESGLGAMQPGTMLVPHRGVATVKSPLLAPPGSMCHTTDDHWFWAWDSRTSTTACSKLHTSTFDLMKVDTVQLWLPSSLGQKLASWLQGRQGKGHSAFSTFEDLKNFSNLEWMIKRCWWSATFQLRWRRRGRAQNWPQGFPLSDQRYCD